MTPRVPPGVPASTAADASPSVPQTPADRPLEPQVSGEIYPAASEPDSGTASKRKRRKTARPARRRTAAANAGEAPGDHAKPRLLSKQEWIERELAKMPPRSAAWRAETLRLWGFKSANPDDLDESRVEAETLAAPVDDDSADIAS
jgi:hypothetical protein